MIVSSPSWNKAPTVYACFGGVSLGEHTAISTSGCDWGPSGMLRLVSRLEGGHLARLWSDWWGVRGNCALARLSTCEKAECRANLQCRCVPVKAKAFTRPKQTFADGKSQSILILDPWFYFFKPSLLLEPPPPIHTRTHTMVLCAFSVITRSLCLDCHIKLQEDKEENKVQGSIHIGSSNCNSHWDGVK